MKSLTCSLFTALSIVALASATARADVGFELTLAPEAEAFAAEMGFSLDELRATLTSKISEGYGLLNPSRFMRAFANAAAFSQRGTGVDYASQPDITIFGVDAAVSVAGQLEPAALGASGNFALMTGLNLGAFGHPKWTITANGMHIGSHDRFASGFTSAGVHAQYKFRAPRAAGHRYLLQWQGADLTTGLELTRWNLGIDGDDRYTISVPTPDGEARELAVQGGGAFQLRATTLVVPVEVTTGVRLAMLATLYGGIGADLQVGRSTLNAAVEGGIYNGEQAIAAMRLTANESGRPDLRNLRLMLGLQANLWRFKIFVQGSLSEAPAASIATGLRLVL